MGRGGRMADAATLPELRFRLPGDWWTTDLTDRDAAVASAHRLVRHRIGPQDDRVLLRQRVIGDFTRAIDAAIEAKGLSMFMAISIAEGVPIPITFTVHLPDVSLSPAIGTKPDVVLDILEQGIETLAAGERTDPGDPADRVRIDLPETRATRLHRVRVLDVGSGDDIATVESLIVDYWVAIPDSKRILLVSFSTSMAQLQEFLLPFFDAIMRAAIWDHAADADA